jgi:uncharacterized YigZ family protein
MTDRFQTIAGHGEFRQKIERSEFLAIAFPIESEERFFDELARIEKQHFDATHHCWAFRLREGRERSSDAGEPNGTAGKPILAAIDGANLTDVAVVVVRWYGGVKLGSGGLTRAYRGTASTALESADIIERFVYERFTVEVPFAMLNVAYRLVDPPAVVLEGESFAESNHFTFDVRQSRAGEFERALTDRRLTFSRDATPRLRSSAR